MGVSPCNLASEQRIDDEPIRLTMVYFIYRQGKMVLRPLRTLKSMKWMLRQGKFED
ncbi:MAG TPA: hypothetical protein PLN21_12885 [Gemmatales bacterium]|nr:hypothetical protein [Gemmatales bacterium]